MSLTRRIVDNRYIVWSLALGAAIFGALAYTSLPMQLFPETSPPVVNVITAYPGAAAEDVAEEVSQPLEEEVATIDGVVEVQSSAQDNLSMTTVEFRYHRDADLAAVDVQNAIARIRGELPDGIREPQVLTFSTSDRPAITVGVAGEDLVEARRRAEDAFGPRLQRVDGVAAVDVFGGAREAVLVELAPEKLEAYRIPFFRVVKAIQTHDMAGPAGSLRTERTRTNFRVEARADDLRELAAIPLTMPGGSKVELGDLATLRHGSLDDDARFSIDGRRMIAMQLFKREEANTVDVVERVQEVVDELDEANPSVDFVVGEESASFTEQSIGNLLTNIWQALLLASIIIFLFIGRVRASAVAIVSMPLSYGLTFVVMKATGVEFNMVTLSAVILAVGMVVDASVVVLENIARRRSEGLEAEEAAVEGADEVRTAVLAGVATTVIVLVPLLFITGFVGKTFGPLAKTLLAAFGSSVLVALVLVPVLSIYTGGESWIDRVGQVVAGPFQAAMSRVKAFYLGGLDRALNYRLVTVVVAVALFVGGVSAIRSQGMDVLPKMDGGSFFVSLETPSGSSLEETERVVRAVEKRLEEESEVVKIQSQVGFEQGMKTTSTGAQGPTQGFISVTLTPRTEREESIWSIERRIRDKIRRVPGIRTFTVREIGNTVKSTTKAPVVVRVSGEDPRVLDRLGERVVEALEPVDGVVEPVRNWRIDQKRMRVEVDALRAGQMGLAPAGVARRMAAGMEGVAAGDFDRPEGEPVPMRVRYERGGFEQPSDLLEMPVFVGKSRQPVPLDRVAHLEETRGRALVTRQNFRPTLEISAYTGDRALSFIMADVREAVDTLELPRDYQIEVSGERDDLNEAKSKLGGAFGVALVAVYLLLVAQLRSFLHPLTVMGAVPLSLAGVGGALWWAGQPVSMPVMVGLILLVGTVVNNAILLIDFIRQARRRGEGRREALRSSVAVRFRPIMMTSLSTIVGMYPLAAEWALGAERFSPLATAVIGGLAAATFLTMVVIPVFYDLLDDFVEWMRRLVGWGESARASGKAGVILVGLAVSAASLVLPVGEAAAREPQAGESAGAAVVLDVEISVERARRESWTLEARERQQRAASHRKKSARGRFLPRLDVKGRASKVQEVEPGTLEMPQSVPGREPPQVEFGEPIDRMYSLRGSLTQPVFNGLSLVRRYQAAGIAEELAAERRRRASKDLRLRVVKAYFGLYRARELRRVADKSVDVLKAHLSKVRTLADAGRATELDVSRVRSRLASARGRQARARAGAQKAHRSLATMLGLAGGTEIELSEAPTKRRLRSERALVDRAVEARPEVEMARLSRRMRERKKQAKWGALWPQLSVQAGYTVASPHERYFPPREEFNGAWDVSLVLSWNAWSWGTQYYEAKAARAEELAAQMRVRRAERWTRLEVQKQRIDVRAGDRRVESARQAVETARDALERARRMFQAGRATTTEVLDSEMQVVRARSELVRARVDRRIAREKLRRLVGAAPTAEPTR